MSDNPFQSPETVTRPAQVELIDGAPRRSVEELLAIAKAQRWVMVAILAHLVAMFLHFFVGPKVAPLTFAMALVSAIVGLIGVFRLASRIYRSRVVGALNGLAMFLPLIGLFILLILNGRATRLLRKYGVRVGLMGADANDLREVTQELS